MQPRKSFLIRKWISKLQRQCFYVQNRCSSTHFAKHSIDLHKWIIQRNYWTFATNNMLEAVYSQFFTRIINFTTESFSHENLFRWPSKNKFHVHDFYSLQFKIHFYLLFTCWPRNEKWENMWAISDDIVKPLFSRSQKEIMNHLRSISWADIFCEWKL